MPEYRVDIVAYVLAASPEEANEMADDLFDGLDWVVDAIEIDEYGPSTIPDYVP